MSVVAACVRKRGGTISFTSAMAITGNCLMNSRNHIENQPKLPSRIDQSTQVGLYVVHCQGSNSCESDGTTITNRSNHIPRLMKIERIQSHAGFLRSLWEKSERGKTMLQMIMIHAAHAHCPKTRFQK